MEFKIDTKDNFTTISPLSGQIDAKMADALAANCEQLRQSGSKNFIIDLQHCTDIDEHAIGRLIGLHEENYSRGHSLVYAGVNQKIRSALKKDEKDLVLNIAPSMVEAIDIISMEILERDLYNEE